jgi:alkanesulfonate monooxygenase SsuD/methylene tetrahydromethanopterin reductase-like flavin-dependent oxidoreductase (luciferase family)
VSDHMFMTAGNPRRAGVSPECDPLTVLAAVAGISDGLELQTLVANTAWIHPALLIRHFAQLAVIAGGARVTAGLGAGWNSEEFESLGMELPSARARMRRFEEALHIARELFDRGLANLAGEFVSASDLPLSPQPTTPPRLLVGGGSDSALTLAGRYADIVDLQGHPKYGKLAGDVRQKSAIDARRRAQTTVDELAERIELVRAAARDAGRAADSVTASVQVSYVAYGSPAQIEAAEHEVLEKWAQLPPRPLADNPFVLLGEPGQIAEKLEERAERFGLSRISIGERDDVASAPPDPLRLCREVVPLLAGRGRLTAALEQR